jgi:hypothetical protein
MVPRNSCHKEVAVVLSWGVSWPCRKGEPQAHDIG